MARATDRLADGPLVKAGITDDAAAGSGEPIRWQRDPLWSGGAARAAAARPTVENVTRKIAAPSGVPSCPASAKIDAPAIAVVPGFWK